ncbi:MAG TPA: hypothetical protein VGC57_17145 [Cellulomonas sp.]
MTLEEFRRCVRVPHGQAARAACVGGGLVVRNVDRAAEALDPPATFSPAFWDVFWSTAGTRGATDLALVVDVWGPLALLPLAVAALVADVVLRRSRTVRAYRRFQLEGWVGQQVAPGVRLRFLPKPLGSRDVVVLAGPGLSAEQLREPVADLSARVRALGRHVAWPAWNIQVQRRAGAGLHADDDLVPELPAGAIVGLRRGTVPHVVVLDGSATGGEVQILAMRDVPVSIGV